MSKSGPNPKRARPGDSGRRASWRTIQCKRSAENDPRQTVRGKRSEVNDMHFAFLLSMKRSPANIPLQRCSTLVLARSGAPLLVHPATPLPRHFAIPALRYPGTPLSQHSAAPALRRSNAPVPRCSCALLLRRFRTPLLRCSTAPALRCSGTPELCCSGALLLRCSVAPALCSPLLRCCDAPGFRAVTWVERKDPTRPTRSVGVLPLSDAPLLWRSTAPALWHCAAPLFQCFAAPALCCPAVDYRYPC